MFSLVFYLQPKKAFASIRLPQEEWHCRLGHPSFAVVQHVLQSNKIPCISNSTNSICNACQQGKTNQLPFPSSNSVSLSPLELIFSDVWGPVHTSVGGPNTILVSSMILVNLLGYNC